MSGFVNDLSQLQKNELIKFNEYLDENIEKIKKEIETKLNTPSSPSSPSATTTTTTSPTPTTSSSTNELKIWNINLEKLSNQRDIILLKFLRAREFKLEAAKQMLIDSLVWRKQFNVDGILNEQFPDYYKDIGEIWSKADKDGRPIMVNYYHKINPDIVFKDGVNQFIRWKVQQMERAIQDTFIPKNWAIEDMVVIHDYKDVSIFKPDARIKQASNQTITTLQNNYPEFLAKKLFINVPWIMEKLIALFSVFTSERTKSKFIVCSDNYREKLLRIVDVDNFPQRLGGFEDNDIPIQQIKIEPLKNHIIDLGKLDSDKTIEWEFTSTSFQKDLCAQIISSINTSSNNISNVTIDGSSPPSTTNSNNNNNNKNNNSNNNNNNNNSPNSSPTMLNNYNNNNIFLQIKPKDFNCGSVQIEEDGYYKFCIKNHFNEQVEIHYRILTKSRLTHSVNLLSKDLENTKIEKDNQIINQLDEKEKEKLDNQEKEKLENNDVALI